MASATLEIAADRGFRTHCLQGSPSRNSPQGFDLPAQGRRKLNPRGCLPFTLSRVPLGSAPLALSRARHTDTSSAFLLKLSCTSRYSGRPRFNFSDILAESSTKRFELRMSCMRQVISQSNGRVLLSFPLLWQNSRKIRLRERQRELHRFAATRPAS